VILHLGEGDTRCAIDTRAGGRLCSLVIAGRERLLTEPAAGVEPSIAWGCFVMAPFVGRVSEGQVSWNGRTARLPLNDGRQAIHGAVFDRPWQVAMRTRASATLTCEFDAERWPFRGSMTQRITIGRDRLRLDAAVVAEEPMPAAIGWHPWFRSNGEDLRVELLADSVLDLAPNLIPTGVLRRVDDRTDLRARPTMSGRQLDDVYAVVESPAVVEWPDLELTLAFDAPVGSAVVCRRPEAVCVEPSTAWPDSIRLSETGRSDTGLVILGAGDRLQASTTWTWVAREPTPPSTAA
jgi:aldose 1-epimerase